MGTVDGNYGLSYCRTPQCKICQFQLLDRDPTFYSNLAIKQFNINGDGSCDTKNCIYVIMCKQKNCHMCYIGYTTTKLNKRLSGHRANIINGTEGIIMLHRFTKHHSICDMIIKPIDICDKEVLKNRERFWMQELNSIFPYGLNNRINVYGIKDSYNHTKYNSGIPVYSLFNLVKNNRTKRGSGINHKNVNGIEVDCVEEFNVEDFINKIADNVVFNIAKHTRKLIMPLKIDEVKVLFIYVSRIIFNDYKVFLYNEYLLYMVKDVCLYRLKNHMERVRETLVTI